MYLRPGVQFCYNHAVARKLDLACLGQLIAQVRSRMQRSAKHELLLPISILINSVVLNECANLFLARVPSRSCWPFN